MRSNISEITEEDGRFNMNIQYLSDYRLDIHIYFSSFHHLVTPSVMLTFITWQRWVCNRWEKSYFLESALELHIISRLSFHTIFIAPVGGYSESSQMRRSWQHGMSLISSHLISSRHGLINFLCKITAPHVRLHPQDKPRVVTRLL